MNKPFFAILALTLTSQLNGLEKDLYPHDYPCAKHHFNVSYPYRETRANLIAAITGKYEPEDFWISRSDDEHYCRFKDGKAPLVYGLKAFRQDKELESHTQSVTHECVTLCNLLGRPIGFDGNYLIPQENNFYWNRLRNQLANPQIARWENILKQSPAFWQAAEKAALTANLLGSKKPDYFKQLLLPPIAKLLAAVFNAQSLFYCEKLDEKDVLITQAQAEFRAERIERNQITTDLNAERVRIAALQRAADTNTEALQNANARLDGQQRIANANLAELQRLEPNKDAYLRTLRQKLGEAVYNSQTLRLEPSSVQTLEERRTNPTAEHMQAHERDLSIADFNPLYELIIKKAQVDPQNAKALLVSFAGNIKFATSEVYIALIRKLQADAARLNAEKAELVRNYAAAIATTDRQANQIGERANRAFQAFEQEITPLRRELPTLRNRVREQDVEIQALRTALAPRNQQ